MNEMELQEKADEIVTRHALRGLTDSLTRINKEIKNEGCGCLACVYDAVNDTNSWTEWVDETGSVCEENTFWVTSEGKIAIGVQPTRGWSIKGGSWVEDDNVTT